MIFYSVVFLRILSWLNIRVLIIEHFNWVINPKILKFILCYLLWSLKFLFFRIFNLKDNFRNNIDYLIAVLLSILVY